MTETKEKTGICKSVVIATVVAIRDVVKSGFHCISLDAKKTCRVKFFKTPANDIVHFSVCVSNYYIFLASILIL